MGLEGNGTLIELALEILARLAIGLLSEIIHQLAVEEDLNVFALHNDVMGVPLVVADHSLDLVRFDFLHRVDAARFAPVALSLIDLGLVATPGPTRILVLGVDVDATVGVGGRLHIHLQLKVFEGSQRAGVKIVGPLTLGLEAAVCEAPRGGRLVDLPAGPRAVGDQGEALGIYVANLARLGFRGGRISGIGGTTSEDRGGHDDRKAEGLHRAQSRN